MYQTPEKIPTKKWIQIIAIIIAILWSILFIINYVNYTKSKPLIFAFHTTKEYDDGYVEEYTSLGYVYRIYNRVSIAKEEFVPFWVGRKNPEAQPDLPKAEVIPLEKAPANPQKKDRFRGLLYYYNKKRELVGIYKCLNSNGNCSKAFGGWDKYNTKNKDALTKIDDTLHTLGTLYDKYAFVDDSIEQELKYGDDAYQRIIYLYRFEEGNEEILAKYSDIKESAYDSEKELASGDYNKYIVKSTDNKWGVISISEGGTITEELPFEYDSIDFDSDTKYYILCKNDVWSVYDLENKKAVVEDVTEPIYNVWQNDNLTYYYKTGVDRFISSDSYVVDYKVYRLDDKKAFLDIPHVTQVIEKGTCIIYITMDDNVLHFMDYGKEERHKIQLAFSTMHHTDLNHPAFAIWRETSNHMTFRIYKGRELKYDYDTVTVNIVNWEYNS